MAFVFFNPTLAAATKSITTLRGHHDNKTLKCNATAPSTTEHKANINTTCSKNRSVGTTSSLMQVQQALKTSVGAMLMCTAMVMSPVIMIDGMIITVTTTPAVAGAIGDEQPLVFDHDQTLVGANFANRSDLKGAIFSKANCKGANFNGSDLSNAQLDDANMIGANLEGVTAVNVSATKTKFQKANLKKVDFTNANLISAIFDGADIEGADFSDSLIDKVTTLKLCKVAKGVHPKTGVATAESLMCPE